MTSKFGWLQAPATNLKHFPFNHLNLVAAIVKNRNRLPFDRNFVLTPKTGLTQDDASI